MKPTEEHKELFKEKGRRGLYPVFPDDVDFNEFANAVKLAVLVDELKIEKSWRVDNIPRQDFFYSKSFTSLEDAKWHQETFGGDEPTEVNEVNYRDMREFITKLDFWFKPFSIPGYQIAWYWIRVHRDDTPDVLSSCTKQEFSDFREVNPWNDKPGVCWSSDGKKWRAA